MSHKLISRHKFHTQVVVTLLQISPLPKKAWNVNNCHRSSGKSIGMESIKSALVHSFRRRSAKQ